MRHLLVSLFLLAAPAWAAPVTLKTADGVTLQADAQGAGERGVILLHGDGRSRADWSGVAAALARQKGVQVISVDLRGHGATGGTLTPEAYLAMVEDAKAAATWLRAKGAKKVAVVGMDLGGSVALHAAAADPAVGNVILVNPRLSVQGFKVTEALAALGTRPILLLAAADDTTGSRAATAIGDKATGPKKVELAAGGGGVGPAIFQRNPNLEGLIVSWIATDGQPDGPVPSATGALTSGGGGEIKTTGTRIGESSGAP